MTRKPLLLVGVLAICGCATAAAPPATPQLGQGEPLKDSQGRTYHVECSMERPTGSNIAEKVCRTVRDVDATQRLQDQFRLPSPGRNYQAPGG